MRYVSYSIFYITFVMGLNAFAMGPMAPVIPSPSPSPTPSFTVPPSPSPSPLPPLNTCIYRCTGGTVTSINANCTSGNTCPGDPIYCPAPGSPAGTTTPCRNGMNVAVGTCTVQLSAGNIIAVSANCSGSNVCQEYTGTVTTGTVNVPCGLGDGFNQNTCSITCKYGEPVEIHANCDDGYYCLQNCDGIYTPGPGAGIRRTKTVPCLPNG